MNAFFCREKRKTTSDHEASANEEFLWTTTDNGVNARERSTRKRGGRKTKIIITIKMVRCIIIILIAVVFVVIISMRIVLGVYLGSSSILLRDFLFACGFFPLFLLILLRFSFFQMIRISFSSILTLVLLPRHIPNLLIPPITNVFV